MAIAIAKAKRRNQYVRNYENHDQFPETALAFKLYDNALSPGELQEVYGTMQQEQRRIVTAMYDKYHVPEAERLPPRQDDLQYCPFLDIEQGAASYMGMAPYKPITTIDGMPPMPCSDDRVPSFIHDAQVHIQIQFCTHLHYLRQVVHQNENGSITTALYQSIVNEFIPRNDDESLSARPARVPRDIHRVASSESESSHRANTLVDRVPWGTYTTQPEPRMVLKAKSKAAQRKPVDFTKVKTYHETPKATTTEVVPTETPQQAVQPMPIRIAGTSLSIKSAMPSLDGKQRRVTTDKGLIAGLLEVAKTTQAVSVTSTLTQPTLQGQPHHTFQKGGDRY
jgi:hypothetical protein